LIRYQQNAVLGELVDEALGFALGALAIDIEIVADFVSKNKLIAPRITGGPIAELLAMYFSAMVY
jgi:hypothetical protein